jgi:hypothetical protein
MHRGIPENEAKITKVRGLARRNGLAGRIESCVGRHFSTRSRRAPTGPPERELGQPGLFRSLI